MGNFEHNFALGESVANESPRSVGDLRRYGMTYDGDDRFRDGLPTTLLVDLPVHLTSERNRRRGLRVGWRRNGRGRSRIERIGDPENDVVRGGRGELANEVAGAGESDVRGDRVDPRRARGQILRDRLEGVRRSGGERYPGPVAQERASDGGAG